MRRLIVFCVASFFFCNSTNSQDLTTQDTDIVLPSILLVAAPPMRDMPMGQGSPESSTSILPEDNTAGDDNLFGTPGGGYVHPFISIEGAYTDNVFNVNKNERSNFLTEITPGIWFALPRRKNVPLHIAPNNTSVGGLRASLPEYESFDRVNAYLLGGLNFKMYPEDSDLNYDDAVLEGFFKYNLRGGLSFEVIDRFTRSHDRFDVGNATADYLRQYYSNLFIGNIDWLFSEKFRAKIEYSNFYLDYRDDINEFMDRDDNAIALYGFYNYSIKTTLFWQYKFVDVTYDSAESRDNEQYFIYGGINWVSTEKTSFSLKAGYQNREYKNSQRNDAVEASNNVDNDGFVLDLAFRYKITCKTGLTLGANHALEESDSFSAIDKTVTAGTIRYDQEFTERLLGLIDFRYERANYGQLTGERDDQRYFFRPALQYVFSDWLMAEIAYEYDTRNSTEDLFEYDTNTFSFSLNAAL